MNVFNTLEFNIILERLSEFALSEEAKKKLLALEPFLDEKECNRKMRETTKTKAVLDTLGSPPLSFMSELEKILELTENGSMLTPEQLASVVSFIHSCHRMKAYLKRAEDIDGTVASYGQSFHALDDLLEEIQGAIKGVIVDDSASPSLRDIRRKISNAQANIKLKLENILRNKSSCFSDSHITSRNGRLVLPVKKSHKSQVPGSVIDSSSTGNTLFIEPTAVRKLQDELSTLEIDEDNEVRKILYTLTSLVEIEIPNIKINMECMEMLDFAFAKAKLSESMNGIDVPVTSERKIHIVQGRHPLLAQEICVPLDFNIGDGINGVVITGPNTGGKTVALKTVGLLSLMAQCGLHVPAEKGSLFSMNCNMLCDIGDGQSITENLSTFSAHITNIVEILSQVTSESLVILDELGSGTDPTEGMGIAIAILEELRIKNCLFLATTHYPEIKDYAKNSPTLINARMDFDRENLKPLYKLQIGEAGTSCALHIAQRLGLPEHMLYRAEAEAYGQSNFNPEVKPIESKKLLPRIIKDKPLRKPVSSFVMGDSVAILPGEEIGIVYKAEDEMGNLIVQVKGEKIKVNHKRLKLKVSASELYPDDYDFSIIFNTVEERNKIKKGYTF